MSDYRRGFGLHIGFTDHLYVYIRFGTTNNYSDRVNLSIIHKSP
jgi:hypothetical protein